MCNNSALAVEAISMVSLYAPTDEVVGIRSGLPVVETLVVLHGAFSYVAFARSRPISLGACKSVRMYTIPYHCNNRHS
jgi:hypothetical protein